MNIIKNTLTFQESFQFVEGVISSVFTQDEQGNDVDYSPTSLQPLINSTFVEMYTDYVFTDDFDENFALYMNFNVDDYLDSSEVNGVQLKGMLEAIKDGIDYRKQLLLDSKTSQSKMYSSISSLIDTLNSKAEQIDIKKIEKVIKKLNVTEIIKAYQKSGIGNDVRDKAIQDLAKENKELKNQISARNVMSGE